VATLPASGLGESSVVDGSVDGSVFAAFIERVLRPSPRPGQIVVLDNLDVHKNAQVRQQITANGCQVVYRPS
jgi:hypothetical protein